VHPTGGSRRVFRHFAWLEAGSGKAALSRPIHQRVTPAVGTLFQNDEKSKQTIVAKDTLILVQQEWKQSHG